MATAHLTPQAAEIAQRFLFPQGGVGHLAQAGFLGLCVPPRYGGAGANTLSLPLTIEGIAKACASTALSIVAHVAAKLIASEMAVGVAERALQVHDCDDCPQEQAFSP